MPTYEYSCPTCGTYDVEQRISERALTACAKCGSPIRRLISGSSFVLKGSGWYRDGYGASRQSANKDGACTGKGPEGGCGGPCSSGKAASA